MQELILDHQQSDKSSMNFSRQKDFENSIKNILTNEKIKKIKDS